ncbi:hypothetical protein ADUPG1_005774, partial [Aduncisulcus paluster]
MGLKKLERELISARWAANVSTGRAAPYFKNSTLSKRLLFAFPLRCKLRVHNLTKSTAFPEKCPFCQQNTTQTHVLGGCETLMPLYRGRHNEVRDRLADVLMAHNEEWEITMEH